MKKKLLITLLISSIIAAPAFCADNFTKRLNICNPYKTKFTAKNGETYTKSVMGAHLEIETGLRSCVYYIQEAQNVYKLCNIPMSALKRDNIDFSAANAFPPTLTGSKKCKESSQQAHITHKELLSTECTRNGDFYEENISCSYFNDCFNCFAGNWCSK